MKMRFPYIALLFGALWATVASANASHDAFLGAVRSAGESRQPSAFVSLLCDGKLTPIWRRAATNFTRADVRPSTGPDKRVRLWVCYESDTAKETCMGSLIESRKGKTCIS
jgi:hypothetical protein